MVGNGSDVLAGLVRRLATHHFAQHLVVGDTELLDVVGGEYKGDHA